jgi:hypothetical protein
MRRSLFLLAAAFIFFVTTLPERVTAQQAPAQGARAAQGGRGGRQASPGNGQVPPGRGDPVQPGAGRGGGRGRRGGGPSKPAPRTAAGKILLGGATPQEKGVWLPAGVVTTSFQTKIDEIPFQPWAKALYEDRQSTRLEPHARCKPSGAARQLQTPYGAEFVDMPDIGQMFIFDIGGPHTYRRIYMDGRSHPAHPEPSFYGHNIGWWEGDTLVVDAVGFNENFWLDRGGSPHTVQLHTLERFTRLDHDTMKYELTIDDPGAYTKPWSGSFNFRWEAGTELFEYVCQESNYAGNLMVGAEATSGTVDRTSIIIP